MKSLAQEVAPQRIRVNSIAPSAIRTPISAAAWSKPEAYERLMTLVPYKRIGEPEDIARAVVWLASDDSDYVVGTTLFVDGGLTLYRRICRGRMRSRSTGRGARISCLVNRANKRSIVRSRLN